MTTVLAVYNSDGCVGRCDAKCHDAKEPECVCICGGANHGGGLSKAIENTRELFVRMLEDSDNGDKLVAPLLEQPMLL